MLSFTEENYLKALVELIIFDDYLTEIGVNKLAEHLNVKPASVTDMVKKLNEKSLVNYQRYGKISLTNEGKLAGMMVIRRHRLWETFLQSKLGFSWDEVHEVAEELEHIHSSNLINILDSFLEYPSFDPHGEAIPNALGEISLPYRKTLKEISAGKSVRFVAVKDDSKSFLQYVSQLNLKMNDIIDIQKIDQFDELITIQFQNESKVVSPKFAENIYVVCAKCNKVKDCNC